MSFPSHPINRTSTAHHLPPFAWPISHPLNFCDSSFARPIKVERSTNISQASLNDIVGMLERSALADFAEQHEKQVLRDLLIDTSYTSEPLVADWSLSACISPSPDTIQNVTTDLRTGVFSLADTLSWISSSPATTDTTEQEVSNFPIYGPVVTDLRTGFTSPLDSLEWLDQAEKLAAKARQVAAALVGAGDALEESQGVEENFEVQFDSETDSEDGNEPEYVVVPSASTSLPAAPPIEYLIAGKHITVARLTELSQEWVTTFAEFVALRVPEEIDEDCKQGMVELAREKATFYVDVLFTLKAFERANISPPPFVLKAMGQDGEFWSPSVGKE